MPTLQRRHLVPIAAILAGSWVGLGAPADVRALGRSGDGGGILGSRPLGSASSPAVDRASPLDPSLLPDPTPWPQLNPTASVSRAWLLAEGPLHAAEDPRRLVTFTFDDGPFPETTPVVLHILARHHVRAAFFWIGRYLIGDGPRATATRETAKQVEAAGHLIGNHTKDHLRLTTLTHAQAIAEIDDGARAIERTLGKSPLLFRPPYGQLDAYSEALLQARGQTLVLWNIEVGDMKRDDAEEMADDLRRQLDYAGGGIVLLHDIRFSSAEALDKLLVMMDAHRYDASRPERAGYEVVDLVEYMRRTAAKPQPYADRIELEKARADRFRSVHPTAGPPAPVGELADGRSATQPGPHLIDERPPTM